MKKLLAAVICSVSLLASAQDRGVGIALERFATIAGGWWLNQRCKTLTPEETSAFAQDLAVVNASLAATLDAPTVLRLQGSAKRGSEDPRYQSCSEEVREIVRYTASAVRAWSMDIRRAVLEGAAKLPGPR